MQQNSLVSIIIPTHNDSQYLKESIGSALRQTYKNIEVIVVNDGSTREEDIRFFEDFQNKFPDRRIKLINQKNSGLAMARNNGIIASSGEFFVPLDSDDLIDPDFVIKTLEIIQNDKDIGVVYTDQKFFGDEDKIMKMHEFDFLDLLVSNRVSVCSLVRKEVFTQVQAKNGFGYNPNMKYGYEDWDFWISVFELGWSFKYINEPLFLYRRHGVSMSTNTLKNHGYLVNQIMENHRESYENNSQKVALRLHNLYKDKELLNKQVEENHKSNLWIIKKFLKNVFRR